MMVACPKCGLSFPIPSEVPGSTFPCPGCRRSLRLPPRTINRPAPPRAAGPSGAGVRSGPTKTSASAAESSRRMSAPAPRRAVLIAAAVLGISLGVAGIGWFSLLCAMPWAGWDSPIGSALQSLHGVAALGFGVLVPLSLGLGLTRRLRPACSAVALLLFILVAIGIAGLGLLFAAAGMLTPSSILLLAVHGVFVVGCAAIHLLLK